jgi:hypothetical protein
MPPFYSNRVTTRALPRDAELVELVVLGLLELLELVTSGPGLRVIGAYQHILARACTHTTPTKPHKTLQITQRLIQDACGGEGAGATC